ncbi:hypothetical protein HYPSUDRAFT_1054143 [Hypholoma sublateritium FD-334 SS-4]|uniref:Uncharacterized protein n=1 Tax=Hypholoma sublateritium (strain FD-334 SS-4) TaxID=945553 RepID=A0A0D2M126_HYPSF|nr:hypothetical protein HYPSUDRAFT_1054143 [Hypholoma sublateritium FD-334 SS-4]
MGKPVARGRPERRRRTATVTHPDRGVTAAFPRGKDMNRAPGGAQQFPPPMTFSPPEAPRKRTSSFSCAVPPSPRPAKALRRSETLLSFADALPPSSSPCATAALPAVPYHRTLQFYKDQRLKRKALSRAGEPLAICTVPVPITTTTPIAAPIAPVVAAPTPKPTAPLRLRRPSHAPQVVLPSVESPITTLLSPRASSPLAPTPPAVRPPRPVFPRARAPPDLYRAALRGRMAGSPEGRRVLLMGARLALSIDAATKELERIVADHRDGDCVMADGTGASMGMGVGMGMGGMSGAMGTGTGAPAPPVLTASWVVVKGEDWEMVDCAA